MDNEERTAFTSLLAQLESRNKRIKDLERQLDNYFIVSQKYLKLKQVLSEIKEVCDPYRDMPIHEFVAILRKIEEVENETTTR